MRQWIQKHKETISIMLVIGGALLAGIVAGGLLIMIASVIRTL